MTLACLCGWGLLGLVGDYALASAWRQIQSVELERSVRAVASLVRGDEWTVPWESDPGWIDLEQRLEADLVPQGGNAAASTIEKVATENVASEWSGATGPTWARSPDRHWLVSVSVPIASSDSPVRVLRATRVIKDSPSTPIWWNCWSVLGAAIFTGLLFRSRKQEQVNDAWQSLLEPWQQIVNSKPPADRAQLPRPHDLSHNAAPAMAAIATTVNDWLSELQQAQARTDLVLGNLNEGIFAIDQAGKTLLVNPALRRQFGVAGEAYLLRPFVEIVRLPRIVKLIEEILQSRQPCDETLEVGNPRRHLRVLGAPLPLAAGESGALLTVVDNTQLEQSELARRDFITGASHELKTPLAAIRAYAETLQLSIEDDPASSARFLSSILEQADRMNQLVSSMLQLAKAESGTLQLGPERVDAVEALRACLDATAGLANAKQLIFETDLPRKQVLLWGDRDAYQTIASNLLSNAVRYTPSGGRVSASVIENGSWVILSVRDTGAGIAEEDRERIFERFFRVQKDRAAISGGTGLGLAIVKQLVAVLNGKLEVTSRLGEGACFDVWLPAVGFTQSSSNAAGSNTIQAG